MNQLLEHFPVNWIDGMKLNKRHFIQLENSIIERVNDSTGISIKDYEYGLIPSYQPNQPSLDLAVYDGKIALNTCRAITLGGTRVEINNLPLSELTVSIDAISSNLKREEGASYLIILNINPYQRIPVGIPDNEEIPPRQPNSIPQYNLSLVPMNQINTREFTAFNLPLGKLICQSGEFKQDTSYIPPCHRIDAYVELSNRYKELGKLVSDIEVNTLKVFQRSRDEQKIGKVNYLADSINLFSGKVLDFMTNYSSRYHLFYKQESPKFLFEFFVRLAKVIHISWRSLKDRDREEMLNYFHDHIMDYTPNVLKQTIEGIVQLSYNHIDILPILERIETFLKIVNRLFNRLIELKYIPKTKHDILVGEQKLKETFRDKPKKSVRGMFKN